MAIFTPGALVNQISGSIGTLTFRSAGRGNVVAHRARRKRSPSAASTTAQAFYREIQIKWQTLTADQKQQWTLSASAPWLTDRLGIRKATSGRLLFITINLLWHRADGTYVTLPLSPILNRPMSPFVAEGYNTEFWIEPNRYPLSRYGFYVVHGARSFRLQSNQTQPRAFKGWKRIGLFELVTPSSAFSIFTAWNNTLGKLNALEWFSIRLQAVSPKGSMTAPLLKTWYRYT